MSTKATETETELRSLMTRVMSAPLHPLQEKMDTMEARITKLEGATSENRVATRQVNESVNVVHLDMRKRLGALLEGLQDGLAEQAERVDPLAGQLAGLDKQQQSMITTLDATRGEASERGNLLGAAVAACDDGIHMSLTRLDHLHATTATADANQAETLGVSIQRLRELQATADAATAHDTDALSAAQAQLRELLAATNAATTRHTEVLAALQAGQAFANAALAQQHDQSKEIVTAQHVQQTALQDATLALPALLTGLRADLDTVMSSRVDAARASILSGIDSQGAERQQGVLVHLKLIKTLTVINLIALAGIAGQTIIQFMGAR